MATLPTEMLQQIFSDSDVRTAKSLRCCCSRFNELASPIVFESLHIALFGDSLRDAMYIKKDSFLRRLVRKIIFVNTRLDDKYSDYQVWESELDLRETHSSAFLRNPELSYNTLHKAPRIIVEGEPTNYDYKGTPIGTLEMSRQRLKGHHEKFLELLSSEHYAVNSNMLPEVLTEAFPELERIQIQGFPSGGTNINIFEAHTNKDMKEIPVITALSRDTLLSRPFLASRYYQRDLNSSMWYSPLSVLNFLTTAQNKLRSLHLDILPWCIWRPSSKFRYWPFLSTISIAFQNLTNLSLILPMHLFNNGNERTTSASYQIAHMLNCAVNVQTVELVFSCVGISQAPKDSRLKNWHPDRIPDISEIFKRVRWPKLEMLHFRNGGLSEKAFVRFMRAHRRTLRGLFLTDLKLITSDPTTRDATADMYLGGDWRSAMEQVAPLMSLEKVEIEGLLDRVQRHRVLQFVAWLDGHSHSVPTKAHRYWKIYGHEVAAYLQSGGKDAYPPWPRYR
ncbi:MAG: hypothetical protein Q9174_001465 [Haloplaca sp. 1 TL-2023]